MFLHFYQSYSSPSMTHNTVDQEWRMKSTRPESYHEVRSIYFPAQLRIWNMTHCLSVWALSQSVFACKNWMDPCAGLWFFYSSAHRLLGCASTLRRYASKRQSEMQMNHVRCCTQVQQYGLCLLSFSTWAAGNLQAVSGVMYSTCTRLTAWI